MNTKKKKTGKTGNENTSPTPSPNPPASLSEKKKGGNNNNHANHHPDVQWNSSSSSSSGGSACGGQNHRSSSSARVTPAATDPAVGQDSRAHLTKQPLTASSARRMGHEPGHVHKRQNAAEADDLSLDSSFVRRRVPHLSGSGQSDRSDDVVNTASSHRIYHVHDRDEPTNGHSDSDWIPVTDQRSGMPRNSTSLSSLTDDCSSNGNGSDSPALSQIIESDSTQPKRTAAAAVRPQQQPFQKSSPTDQPTPPPPARTKPQMDKEERVKSLAKQANLLIDEGMLVDESENIQIDNEKIEDAIRLLDVAIKIDANDYRLFINRGYCYELQHEYAKALDDADKAVALRPDWANCHFRRGRALAGLEKFKDAEKSFKRSRKFDSKITDEVGAEVYLLRLNACLNLGFPQNEAREAADQTKSVAEAIQFVVQTSADQRENFPATDFPVKSGSVSSCSSFTRVPPEVLSPASSPSAPSASSCLWPVTHSDTSADIRKKADDSEKRMPHHIPSHTSNGSGMQKSVAAAAAALLSDMNGSSGSAADQVRVLNRISGDERIKENNHNNTSSSSLSSVTASATASKPALSQKEILVESVITNRQLFHFCPDLETKNEFGWFALWIGNISPNCSNDLLREMFCIFGELVHCKVYPSDDANDISYALAHFDNDKSPITAMAEYQGAVLRGVSARDKLPLVIRFRPNKEQKERSLIGNNNNINWSTYTGTNNHFVSSDDTANGRVTESGGGGGGGNSRSSPDPSQKKTTPVPPAGECYFWRTTGCRNESACRFAHNPSSKGIDYHPFMKKMPVNPFHPLNNKNINYPLSGRNFRK